MTHAFAPSHVRTVKHDSGRVHAVDMFGWTLCGFDTNAPGWGNEEVDIPARVTCRRCPRSTEWPWEADSRIERRERVA